MHGTVRQNLYTINSWAVSGAVDGEAGEGHGYKKGRMEMIWLAKVSERAPEPSRSRLCCHRCGYGYCGYDALCCVVAF